MRGADVGDHAPIGRGDAGERGNFAGVIHAHFDDGEFMLGHQAQKLQRQTEIIIEIALRLEDVKLCAERGSDGLFGSGFAGRAGDGHDTPTPLAAHMVGERLHGSERIFRDQEGMGKSSIGQGSGTRARDYGGHCAAFECCNGKIVTIVNLTANGKEDLARRDCTRIDRIAGREKRTGIGHAGRSLEHSSSAHRGLSKCEIHCPSP